MELKTIFWGKNLNPDPFQIGSISNYGKLPEFLPYTAIMVRLHFFLMKDTHGSYQVSSADRLF